MGNEKRFLLAVALTFGFLYLWSAYFLPKPKKPVEGGQAPQASPTQAVQPIVTQAPAGAPAERKKEPKNDPPKFSERETTLFQSTWSNQPGSPSRVVLKKYRLQPKKDSPLIQIVPFQGEAPPPLRWEFEAQGKSWSDDGAAYRETSSGDQEISYERQLDGNLTVAKSFTWNPESYWVEEKLTIQNRGADPLKLKAEVTISTGEEHQKQASGIASWLGARPTPLRVSAFINEKATYWTTEEVLKGTSVPPGEIRWAGFDAQYFLMTAIPLEGRWAELKTSATTKRGEAGGQDVVDQARLSMTYPPYEIPGGGSQSYRLRLYMGPKDIGILQKVGNQLDRAIDLGSWLGWIARPMLFFLRWLYSILPNYGLAIILLTVGVRLLMFPLAQSQARSMKRMQAHKPQMDALKEKYKNDKEAYSRELMSYMRTHKINPMGGCLLLLPQLPIFFALYRVLWNSIELRHAPFAFWIRDLSAHDPYFVLPVLLGISMFVQQKMTPTPTADAAQQTMMKVMPLMFTAMMIFLPAGLNLYIFVSTLWGVVQQYWVQRQHSPAASYAEKVRRS